MNKKEAIEIFSDLSNNEQADFLARLAWELTVAARETYEVGTDDLTNPKMMRSINEVQHRLLSQLSAMLRKDENRYPDEVFWQIILDNNQTIEKIVARIAVKFSPALV
ncbi:MAG: hypothetical protein LH472_11410 [Pyrinomonadaceae bacterium]|nr:hypothetical protein [Pyrinomonadaceae bacterium]